MELKLEQVTVHSRDIFARYVQLSAGETLTYSIKPHRNSIFFGLYKKARRDRTDALPSPAKSKNTPALTVSMSFEERLRQADLEQVLARQKLSGGKVCKGSIVAESDCMYALVLDNTFSKQKSKLVTFIVQTYGTTEKPTKTETLLDDEEYEPKVAEEHLTGVLLKRRRKKLQGWARRYFSLDFESQTLSYFQSKTSSVLRGSIPLSVAVVSADKLRNEINIDSGAEVWNLRAPNRGAFVMWCQAISQAGESSTGRSDSKSRAQGAVVNARPASETTQLEKNLWLRLDKVYQSLLAQQNSLRQLTVAETSADTQDRRRQLSPTRSVATDSSRADSAKKPFWIKRKTSDLSVPTTTTEELFAQAKANNAGVSALIDLESKLDHSLQDFRSILTEHRFLQNGPAPLRVLAEATRGRQSFDSVRSEDDVFEDASSGLEEEAGILMVHRDSESEESDDDIEDAMSDASDSLYEVPLYDAMTPSTPRALSPTNLHVLETLPKSVKRRLTTPPILDQPPSALKLISQKVGSDVSGMSVPAASNEPLSLLQRAAEDLEYSELLDRACTTPLEDGARMLVIATFAVSSFSSFRHKERAKRKPFNPMLGETFELVREDKGFCFVAEKVQHRPIVGIASHAQSKNWSFVQYQSTSQKFYGKSMVLTTDGTTTVRLSTGDIYIWEKPTAYLRNASWGEKWLEPSGDMRLRNIVTGESAVIKFKATSTFSSARSEELTIEVFDAKNVKYKKSVSGTWTSALTMDGKTLWEAGSLVSEPTEHCGFTTFAAQMNEITEVERNNLPSTDCRNRPDLRARELGDLDTAERLKVEIEEMQRSRRADLERTNKQHEPTFFFKVGESDIWEPFEGERSYWQRRQRHAWDDLVSLFP